MKEKDALAELFPIGSIWNGTIDKIDCYRAHIMLEQGTEGLVSSVNVGDCYDNLPPDTEMRFKVIGHVNYGGKYYLDMVPAFNELARYGLKPETVQGNILIANADGFCASVNGLLMLHKPSEKNAFLAYLTVGMKVDVSLCFPNGDTRNPQINELMAFETSLGEKLELIRFSIAETVKNKKDLSDGKFSVGDLMIVSCYHEQFYVHQYGRTPHIVNEGFALIEHPERTHFAARLIRFAKMVPYFELIAIL